MAKFDPKNPQSFGKPQGQHFGKNPPGKMLRAGRLEGVVKNRGIKPIQKQRKTP
jgi:hypothetical protein